MKTKNFTRPVFGFLLLLLFTGSSLQAQKLWSAAFIGGATNAGTLIKINPDGTGLTKFYDFNESNGSSPMGTVLQASNGKVYATCINGGQDSSCVIYCYNPDSGTYTNVWSFDIVHGDFPMSGLIQAPDGILYGAASQGNPTGNGVIYSFNTTTNVYTDLYELDSTSGSFPSGSPMLCSNGKLYGMTSGAPFFGGTAYGFGAIYSYDINTNTFTNLHSFSGAPDANPFGALVEHNGLLFGLTSGTPQYAPGLMVDVFNYAIATVPAVSYGNIFSFNPTYNTYMNLHTFDSVSGMTPYGTLLKANDGKLYGVTSAGGAHNMGVIFSLDPANNTYTKLFDFDGTHGSVPMSDLSQSTDGMLYGATTTGGIYTFGVIYRFDPVTHNYTVMQNLDNVTTGSAPLNGAFAYVDETATGILTPKVNTALDVYPIPAHNELTVNLESTTGETPVLTLTDINGRTVWGPRAQTFTGNSDIKLDISALESGVYFLQATTGNGVVVKKVVRE